MPIFKLGSVNLNVREEPGELIELAASIVEGASIFSRLDQGSLAECPVMQECDQIAELLRGGANITRLRSVLGGRLGEVELDDNNTLSVTSGRTHASGWRGSRLVRSKERTVLQEVEGQGPRADPYIGIGYAHLLKTTGALPSVVLRLLEEAYDKVRYGQVRVQGDSGDLLDATFRFPLDGSTRFPPELGQPLDVDGNLAMLPLTVGRKPESDPDRLKAASIRAVRQLMKTITTDRSRSLQ